MERPGLPGLRGADHIGLTVPDLEEASRFFIDVIGAEPLYEQGPIDAQVMGGGDGMTRMLNVHAEARIEKVRHFRLGAGVTLELFHYESPDQKQEHPKNTDWGGHHIALYVDDFDAGIAHLKKHGVRLMEGGRLIEQGPEAGCRSCYFLAPWGLQLELMSYPDGKAFDRGA